MIRVAGRVLMANGFYERSASTFEGEIRDPKVRWKTLLRSMLMNATL
jgi:hypothetical protein